jgi:SAM-dependent methyltransferase
VLAPDALPVPPPELAARVGTVDDRDPVEFYIAEGTRLRAVIEELLPADWSWEGKRALDFGCGAARVLRHFAPEAREARGTHFTGCDLDERSIEWDRAHLSPPFEFFVNRPEPPLDLPAGSVDLVWAMSVFTHIADHWGDWLLEMHRVLAEDGMLIASFLGEGMWEALVGEPYREHEVGTAVLHHWEGSDAWVFHSEWWLREHWGRAFEVLSVRRPERGPGGTPEITHSYIALRRLPAAPDRAELERIDAGDRRELAGLQTALRLARREQAELAAEVGPVQPPAKRGWGERRPRAPWRR